MDEAHDRRDCVCSFGKCVQYSEKMYPVKKNCKNLCEGMLSVTQVTQFVLHLVEETCSRGSSEALWMWTGADSAVQRHSDRKRVLKCHKVISLL